MMEKSIALKNMSEKIISCAGIVFPPRVCVSVRELTEPIKKYIKMGILVPCENAFYKPVYKVAEDNRRILFIMHSFCIGGAEIATKLLIEGLKARGDNIGIVLIKGGYSVDVYQQREEFFEIVDFIAELDDYNYIKGLNEILEMFNPHIIFCSVLKNVIDDICTFRGHPPIIQIIHAEIDVHLASGNSNAIVGVSKEITELVKKLSSTWTEDIKLRTILNGIPEDRVKGGVSLRGLLGISEDDVVVGFVGNINELKAPLLGLKVFASLKIDNACMLIVGRRGNQYEDVKKFIEENNVRAYVLDITKNIKDIYATIDVLINCSSTEGTPLTIIEAMLAGKPVIGRCVGGIPNMIRHGETGFLYNTMEEFRKYLSVVLTNDDLRTRLGKKAHETAKKLFGYDRYISEYNDLIEELVVRDDKISCSILLPVYNCESYIDECLWSIREQTFPNFEVIVVNDGSTDRTLDIIQKHANDDKRIKIINIAHSGIVTALNTGLAYAHTDLIFRMDGDDIMLPNRIATQMEFMKTHPEVSICGSYVMTMDSWGNDIGVHTYPITDKEIKEALFTHNPIAHPTVVFRKSHLKAKNLRYEGDGRAEDYLLWVKCAANGLVFHNIPSYLLKLRLKSDPEYGKWVNSAVPDIQKLYSELVKN